MRSLLVAALLVGVCKRDDAEPAPAEVAPVPPAVAPAPTPKAVANADAKAELAPPVAAGWSATPPSEAILFGKAAAVVTAELLRGHIDVLAADDMRGRKTPSPELDRAADYVAKAYARIGLQAPTIAPEYRQRFECGEPGAGESSNVIGVLPGRDAAMRDQFVLVSAHYDHLGTTSEGTDTIFNGANDNASGVASMLAIAEVLARLPQRPRRSVAFIAFCGEELGFHGSRFYVEHAVAPPSDVVADLNLEMLGRPGRTPKRAWVTGMPYSTLGDVLVTIGKEAGIEFVDGAVVGPVEGNAFERSDNLPLAQAGIVAHSISTGELDQYYHHVDDEAALMDTGAMVPIVRAIARATWRLAEEDRRVTWTDAGKAAGWGR